MANDERPKRGAEAKKDNAIFPVRMVGIVDEQTALITEDGLRFLGANRPIMANFCRTRSSQPPP